MRVAGWVMAALMAACVAVQGNDPDPIRWMALYGAAGAVSVLVGLGRRVRALAGVVGVVAIAWAIAIVPTVPAGVPWADVFTDMPMHSAGVEEVREIGGLLIVAAWMAVVAVRRR